MFYLEKNDEKVGVYLRRLILKKYSSVRQFCRAYLELRDGSTNDEEIRKLLNRFSQILKGVKRIQTDDLPFISDLLGISCEEILSAGRTHVPVSGRMTNYNIAFSKDRSVWERYMKREDKLFLNCDEYCKSVIDYAFEFKNYAFIKYLMDEGFIWFVDLSQWRGWGCTYGAGTSVKRRNFSFDDTFTQLEIGSQDKLRTQTIALAIENGDNDIPDRLLAREIPEMHDTGFILYPQYDFQSNKNDALISAVASAKEEVLSYFSEEFPVTNLQKHTNTFVFPFIGDVIDTMLANNRFDCAEAIIRKMIRHNKWILERLTSIINEAYEYNRQTYRYDFEGAEKFLKQQTLEGFSYDDKNDLVAFYYVPEKHKYIGFVSNLVCVKSDKGNALIRELVIELNNLRDSVIALKGVDSK